LTYSGWFTHFSGHPSATGRAQDRESLPAKDQRSTAVPRNQHSTAKHNYGMCVDRLHTEMVLLPGDVAACDVFVSSFAEEQQDDKHVHPEASRPLPV